MATNDVELNCRSAASVRVFLGRDPLAVMPTATKDDKHHPLPPARYPHPPDDTKTPHSPNSHHEVSMQYVRFLAAFVVYTVIDVG